MNQKSKPHKKDCSVLCISNTSAVKLDFDNMSFKMVLYWAFFLLKLFRSRKKADEWTPKHKIDLEGFLIRKSSPKHYHVIYNKFVLWLENTEVMAWACFLTKKPELTGYVIMQLTKGFSTLRIGNKYDKSSPRTVYTYGKQNSEIKNFLKLRRELRNV